MDVHERRALPEGWEWKRLGDVAQFFYGYPFDSSKFNEEGCGIPLIRIRNLIDGKTETYFDGAFDESYIIKNGDTLIGMDGEFNIVKWAGQEALLNQRVCKLNITSEELLPAYAYRALVKILKRIEDKTPYVTVKHLSAKHLNLIEIPLPPLPTQRRIVSILEKADETKRLRAQADELTDRLLQSVFLEMFGDPVKNPKGWEIKKIRSISEKFSDGPFGSNLKTEHYENKGVRVIRLQNIGIADFLDDNKAYISEKHFSTLRKYTCLPGDVLIGTMGDPNLRACIIPKSIELAINKADCIQCRPNKNLATSEYICHLLNLPSTLDMASNMIHGETRSRISMGHLSTLRIPLPPPPARIRPPRREN